LIRKEKIRVGPKRLYAIWDILVELCGACSEDRDLFIANTSFEYRFMGNLGFGGKIYMDAPPRVSCYKEDETPARLKIIEVANKALSLEV
jgi:hypothetical protein